MPEKFKGVEIAKENYVMFDYGIAVPGKHVDVRKIRSGHWVAKSKTDVISGISNPTIDAAKGIISFGTFTIKVSPTYYADFNPFDDLKAYLLPPQQSVKDYFGQVWATLESKQSFSENDITLIRQIVNCEGRYLTVDQKLKVIKKIIALGGAITQIPESHEDIVLDLLSSYSGDKSVYADATRKSALTDGWGETGIDGVFKKDGQYYIIEAKYSGYSTLKTAADGKQLSKGWIEGSQRLENAVGFENAQDILDKGYRKIWAKVAPNGTVTFSEATDDFAVIFVNFNP